MKPPKFDEHDRKRVISEVEQYFNVNLSRVGSRRKYLEDKNGKSYWILGGYEDWHGIPPDMLLKEEQRSTDGTLVVAKRYIKKIDIFSGQLQPLILNKKKLSHTKLGDYQFNIQIKGNHLYIKELPDLVLTKLGESQFAVEDKVSNKNAAKVKAILNRLTPEERESLLNEFSTKTET